MLLVKDLELLNGKRLSLEILKGKGYVLEGPNGVGKSVLLRTLAALYPSKSGEVLFHGAPVIDVEKFRSDVLYCGSTTHLPGEMTAEEFLASPLALTVYRGFRSVFRTGDYLTRWELAGKRLSVLSSGQKQLLVFLRAMVLRPQLLLLDEPTSHLDREKTLEVEELLRAWKTGDRSYLMISHSEEQVLRLGQKISFTSLLS